MGEDDRTDEAQQSDAARAAAGYDEQIRTMIPGYDVLHEAAAALLTAELGERERARLLAVGAGTGEEIVRIGATNPGWCLTAVDPSAEMLAVARRRFAEAGLADRVEIRAGLVADLPPGESYEGATALLVLHFLPDDGSRLDLLRAIAARLRPGAPLVLATMHGEPGTAGFDRLMRAWGRRQIGRGMAAGDVAEFVRRLPEHVHFVPEGREWELLEEAGFGDAEPFFRALVIGGWIAHRA